MQRWWSRGDSNLGPLPCEGMGAKAALAEPASAHEWSPQPCRALSARQAERGGVPYYGWPSARWPAATARSTSACRFRWRRKQAQLALCQPFDHCALVLGERDASSSRSNHVSSWRGGFRVTMRAEEVRPLGLGRLCHAPELHTHLV